MIVHSPKFDRKDPEPLAPRTFVWFLVFLALGLLLMSGTYGLLSGSGFSCGLPGGECLTRIVR